MRAVSSIERGSPKRYDHHFVGGSYAPGLHHHHQQQQQQQIPLYQQEFPQQQFPPSQQFSPHPHQPPLYYQQPQPQQYHDGNVAVGSGLNYIRQQQDPWVRQATYDNYPVYENTPPRQDWNKKPIEASWNIKREPEPFVDEETRALRRRNGEYCEGDHVDALWYGGDAAGHRDVYYPCVVQKANVAENGRVVSYELLYIEDGAIDKNVAPRHIRGASKLEEEEMNKGLGQEEMETSQQDRYQRVESGRGNGGGRFTVRVEDFGGGLGECMKRPKSREIGRKEQKKGKTKQQQKPQKVIKKTKLKSPTIEVIVPKQGPKKGPSPPKSPPLPAIAAAARVNGISMQDAAATVAGAPEEKWIEKEEEEEEVDSNLTNPIQVSRKAKKKAAFRKGQEVFCKWGDEWCQARVNSLQLVPYSSKKSKDNEMMENKVYQYTVSWMEGGADSKIYEHNMRIDAPPKPKPKPKPKTIKKKRPPRVNKKKRDENIEKSENLEKKLTPQNLETFNQRISIQSKHRPSSAATVLQIHSPTRDRDDSVQISSPTSPAVRRAASSSSARLLNKNEVSQRSNISGKNNNVKLAKAIRERINQKASKKNVTQNCRAKRIAELRKQSKADSSMNDIRNLDKRRARRKYRDDFEYAVNLYRDQSANGKIIAAGRKLDLNSIGLGGTSEAEAFVDVFVRVRPLLQHEKDKKEWCAVTTGMAGCVLHDARMHADMKRKFMHHRHFMSFERVFGPETQNEDVYKHSTAPLVREVANADGRCATVFMFGQTGSGKTYTMNAMYSRAARDLFIELESNFGADVFDEIQITVSFVELLAGSVFDLLSKEGDYAAPLRVMEDAEGRTQLVGAEEYEVKSADDLMTVLEEAMASRATAATGVHEHSSRSHAVCRVTFWSVPKSLDRFSASKKKFRGMLMLVDLAGSERNTDSRDHDAARRKECIQINASLSALKECIRKRALGASHMPFRRSVLTRILRTSLVDPRNSTAVIATISPCATDTEHSHNTLRHACLMAGQSADFVVGGGVGAVAAATSGNAEVTGGAGGEITLKVSVQNMEIARHQARMRENKLPRSWNIFEARQWWRKAAETVSRRLRLGSDEIEPPPKSLDGRALTRLSHRRFVALCNGNENAASEMGRMLQRATDEANRIRTSSAKQISAQRRKNAKQSHPKGWT
eukprot:g3124.t1